MPAFYVVLAFLGSFGFLTAALYGLIVCAQKGYIIDSKLTKVNIFKSFFLYFGIIVIAWLPYFIIFFPGILSSDSVDQWGQAIGATGLNNAHPLFHTMIIRLTTLVSGDKSPWAYSLIQFLIMSASMSFACVWLQLKGLRKYFVWIVLAFFALHPINAMYSITMWKDVLFSASVMLLTVAIAEIVLSKGKSIAKSSYFWLFLISSVCVANLRNNGTLVALLVISLVYIFITTNRRRIAIVVLAVLVSVIIKSVLLSTFNIPESPIRESLAIPIQQISRVVVEGGRISSRDTVLIQKVIPMEEIKSKYVEYYVDPIKFSPKFDNEQLQNNKSAYFGLWWRLLVDNPATYVKAYLEETRGYWDPTAYNWAIFYGIEKNSFALSEPLRLSSQRNSLTAYVNKTQALGPFRLLWSGAAYGYVMLSMLAIMLFVCKRKRWLYLLATAPFMLNWMTLMLATPTATNTRYIYCSFLVFPIIMFLSLNDRKATPPKR